MTYNGRTNLQGAIAAYENDVTHQGQCPTMKHSIARVLRPLFQWVILLLVANVARASSTHRRQGLCFQLHEASSKYVLDDT